MTAQRKAVFVDGVVVAYEDESVGVPGGLASLDGSGKVPSSQLPAYVDDVVEYPDVASFPPVGVSGIIYIAISPAPSQGYRWSGSTYSQIGSSLALGETSSTAYRGDRGKVAYDHSQVTGANPHGTTAAQVGALPASGGTAGDFLIWTSPTSVGSGPLTWDGGPLITTPKGIRSSSSIEGLSLRVSGNPVVDSTRNAHFASVTSDDLAGVGNRQVAANPTGKLVASSRGFLWSDAAKDFNASSSNLTMLSASSEQRKIPANTWVAGKVLQLKIQAIISSSYAGSSSTIFQFLIGPDGSYISPYYMNVNTARALAAGQWSVASTVTIRCVSAGASGVFYYTYDTTISNATGSITHRDSGSAQTGGNLNTIDTTVDRYIDFTEQAVNTDIYGVASSAEWIA